MKFATVWRKPSSDIGECTFIPDIPRPSSRNNDGEDEDSFYVYVLKLNRGGIYVGQTRELQERIQEHKEGRSTYTAGKNPKLQYFEVLPSRHQALVREVEIKRMARRNHSEVRRMITRFHDMVGELNFG